MSARLAARSGAAAAEPIHPPLGGGDAVAEVITTARYGSAGTFINKPQVSEVPNSAVRDHIWL